MSTEEEDIRLVRFRPGIIDPSNDRSIRIDGNFSARLLNERANERSGQAYRTPAPEVD